MNAKRGLMAFLTAGVLGLLASPSTVAQQECEQLWRDCLDHCHYGMGPVASGMDCKRSCIKQRDACRNQMRGYGGPGAGYGGYGAPGYGGYGAPAYGAPGYGTPAYGGQAAAPAQGAATQQAPAQQPAPAQAPAAGYQQPYGGYGAPGYPATGYQQPYAPYYGAPTYAVPAYGQPPYGAGGQDASVAPEEHIPQ